LKYKADFVVWILHDGSFDRMNDIRIPLQQKFRNEGLSGYDFKTGSNPAGLKAQEIIYSTYPEKEIISFQKKYLDKLDSAVQTINNGKSLLLIAGLSLET